ncbi:MAG: L-threonylcarbamoyladenylate synthase [Gemmatimonadaceae bacterium]
MATLRVDPVDPDAEVIARAAELLRRGELVAFPTETVYGLGAHALDERAVHRIFEAKGRPSYNPLIVHVSGVEEARRVAADWPRPAHKLAERYWPGPLTLVLPKRPEVPDVVTAGLASVAIRVPAHAVARSLLRAAGVPVAAPSANRSTELSPTTARHVEKSLGDRVALILDGGPTDVGIESTVLDLSGSAPVLLRPGRISAEDLEPFVGPIARLTAAPRGEGPRPAPGMLERHYAPRATLLLVDPSDATDAERTRLRVRQEAQRGGRVGALVRGGAAMPDAHRVIAMPHTADEYARRLYAALHELDDAGCTLIVVDRVPADGAWAAVADRLERAAHRPRPEV